MKYLRFYVFFSAMLEIKKKQQAVFYYLID